MNWIQILLVCAYSAFAGLALTCMVMQARYANVEDPTGEDVYQARRWAGYKMIAIGLFLLTISINIQVRQ